MILKRIENKDFDYFYSLLEEDFCWEERKDKERELLTFSHPNFRPCFIYDNDQLVGYFCYWEFDDFIFAEHLAILKDIRDNGIGTRFVKEFLNASNKLVIGEVEHPNTKLAQRRVNFYKRLGFKLNEKYNYIQPSYHPTGETVPLIIITYPRNIEDDEYDKYIGIIKREVYEK
jgi:ribosomal protein S18 acetylase RimI-like enzyme